MQGLTLDCLARWGQPVLLEHKEKLHGLIADKSFRETLALFSLVLVYDMEPYSVTWSATSGHTLLPYTKVFWVASGATTCPAEAPESHGGFLDENLAVTIRLPAAHTYVLCLLAPYSTATPTLL
mgnify:CR=1 FL=1